mmetsp:Transcript_16371/g.52056  ORF Transcript_16371/g.52056 Transcript_16371/m.52056 type:complete len:265 (-) Transcript_16371:6-800(-)
MLASRLRAAAACFPRDAHRIGRTMARRGQCTAVEPGNAHEERHARARRGAPSDRMVEAVRVLLEEIGEDPTREGLLRTPKRYAKALMDLTSGYHADLHKIVNGAMFEERHHELVLIKNIRFHSLCEHHILPFVGVAHVAYLPNSRVIGLSKVARITNMFAKRLQVQERMGAQIADTLASVTGAHGVAVALEASHMCMSMRGARAPGATTVTTAMRGRFTEDAGVRAEFLRWVQPAAEVSGSGEDRLAIHVSDAPCVHGDEEHSF